MMLLFLARLLLTATVCPCLTEGTVGAVSETVTTCDDIRNVHRMSCESGVISVEKAMYGRTSLYTCSNDRSTDDFHNLPCSQEGTLKTLKERCDGLTVCEINLKSFKRPDPCPGTYKYLETTHLCLPASRKVTCEGGVAHFDCEGMETVFIYHANYGRSDRTTCSKQRRLAGLRNVDCKEENSTNIVAERCQGNLDCEFYVSNNMFGDPCIGTYKYLDVAYRCQLSIIGCESETLSVVCGDGEVISVYNVFFGRKHDMICSYGRPASETSNTDCIQEDSIKSPTGIVASMCDKKQSCDIDVNTSVFGDPCVGTYKYIDVMYSCIKD